MTPQEAINIIEDVTWQDNGRHDGKIAPAREIAISALEKQIPKKPIKTPDNHKRFCPTCHNPIRLGRNHCCNCGQKIRYWSDTNDR